MNLEQFFNRLNEEMSDDDKKETYKKWKKLVNMSASSLKKYYESETGKKSGLTPKQAKAAGGISTGRQSARWIVKMKETPVKEWTPEMWKWANKQISFISRMKGNAGPNVDEYGNPTRKMMSLKIWGHDPLKG